MLLVVAWTVQGSSLERLSTERNCDRRAFNRIQHNPTAFKWLTSCSETLLRPNGSNYWIMLDCCAPIWKQKCSDSKSLAKNGIAACREPCLSCTFLADTTKHTHTLPCALCCGQVTFFFFFFFFLDFLSFLSFLSSLPVHGLQCRAAWDPMLEDRPTPHSLRRQCQDPTKLSDSLLRRFRMVPWFIALTVLMVQMVLMMTWRSVYLSAQIRLRWFLLGISMTNIWFDGSLMAFLLEFEWTADNFVPSPNQVHHSASGEKLERGLDSRYQSIYNISIFKHISDLAVLGVCSTSEFGSLEVK